jgi:phosphatidylglycerol lysyltransferase
MQNVIQHKKIHMLAATGRGVLVLTMVITAIINFVTALVEFPWNVAGFTESLIDLGGPAWERDGTIVTGILLLLIARALLRRKRQAWWLSLGLLAFSLLSTIFSNSGPGAIFLALCLLLLLLLLAPFFPTRSDTRALIRGYAALLLFACCILSYWGMSNFWYTTPVHSATILRDESLYILHVLTFLVLGYGVVEVLRPVHSTPHSLHDEHCRVCEVVRCHGSLATVHFALSTDMSYFWSESCRSLIAYQVIHGVALALGDPIGPEEELKPLLEAFLSFCRRQDWRVALYQTSEELQNLCQQWDVHSYKIGEEAIIDVAHFTLQGKVGAPVRHTIARASRAGLSAQCWHDESLPDEIFNGMKCISDDWLDTRKAKIQMGFSMGRFPMDWTTDLLTVVALGPQGDVQAFLTWTPLYAGNGWALDTMRRGYQTPPGAMELLIAHSVAWAHSHGYTRMSLGMAPLAGLGRNKTSGTKTSSVALLIHRHWSASMLERSAAFLHQRGYVLGKYRSLYAFKAKFQPSWEARYLIVSEGQALPQTFLALARAHGSGWWSMLNEAWVTVCPVKSIGKSVTRLLRASRLAVEKHEIQERSQSENVSQGKP